MTFGENLARLRKSRGYTQRKLTDALGLSQTAISMYETGNREPSFETLEKIADFFNVPMSTLMPSEDKTDDEKVSRIADALHKNPKLCLLFDRGRLLREEDIDAVLNIVNAITRERESH
jgi:transcriptional regulator with XRE-family HTH domain